MGQWTLFDINSNLTPSIVPEKKKKRSLQTNGQQSDPKRVSFFFLFSYNTPTPQKKDFYVFRRRI